MEKSEEKVKALFKDLRSRLEASKKLLDSELERESIDEWNYENVLAKAKRIVKTEYPDLNEKQNRKVALLWMKEFTENLLDHHCVPGCGMCCGPNFFNDYMIKGLEKSLELRGVSIEELPQFTRKPKFWKHLEDYLPHARCPLLYAVDAKTGKPLKNLKFEEDKSQEIVKVTIPKEIKKRDIAFKCAIHPSAFKDERSTDLRIRNSEYGSTLDTCKKYNFFTGGGFYGKEGCAIINMESRLKNWRFMLPKHVDNVRKRL